MEGPPDIDPATGHGMPRWVKVLAIIGLVAVLLIGVMLLGGHGPGRHQPPSARHVPDMHAPYAVGPSR